jgi:hypothetical protein
LSQEQIIDQRARTSDYLAVVHRSRRPGIEQGWWEFVRLLYWRQGTFSPDRPLNQPYIPDRTWYSSDDVPNSQFWQVYTSEEFRTEKEAIRQRYRKENWPFNFPSLQLLSLQAYSLRNFGPINRIELEFSITPESHWRTSLTHRVILPDDRGVQIRYSTLRPYTSQELQELVSPHYQEWYQAGGFFFYKVYRCYPTFYFDLWSIISPKEPILLEWYRPEVEEAGVQIEEQPEQAGDH